MTSDGNGTRAVDVCVIVEGCYPFVSGGVSSWLDWLIRQCPHLSFAVVAITASGEPRRIRYERPSNLVDFRVVALDGSSVEQDRRALAHIQSPEKAAEALADDLVDMVLAGAADNLSRVRAHIARFTYDELMSGPLTLQIVRRMYDALVPQASFLQFFWAWRALFGGQFSVLKAPLPQARVYHAISTGYAGLMAARAAAEFGRPAVITEHGIYTNERRIEILMADWIADTVDKGFRLSDPRLDIRDLWIRAFEAYSRVAYGAAARITTLFKANQRLQIAGGADPARLEVISNGIDVARFASVQTLTDQPPTVALIGRVVPIKDVKTFIEAVAVIRNSIPDLQAYVLGPTDEDPIYVEECRLLAERLGLQPTLTFTGNARITEYLPRIQVVVLTSLSEAQPLVLLEAGAAGIPCVATDVGACREILEGAGSDEDPTIPGGIVTDLVAPRQVAEAVASLLASPPLRREMGQALQRRVASLYASDRSRDRYSALYSALMAMPDEIGVAAGQEAA
jgi:glycosyltransferase involved in cell wall biosynthesis